MAGSTLARAMGLALVTAAAGWPAGNTAAQVPATVFGGAGVGADEMAYLGATVPVGGSGFALRGIVSTSQYKYRSAGTRITSDQVQGEVSALYQRAGPNGYFDLGVGARYTDTDLSPGDPGNRSQGDEWDVVLSMSGQTAPGPWRAAGFASYAVDSEDYYVRAELTRAVRPSVRLGLEAVLDGDPNYDRRRAGVLLGVSTSPRWEAHIAVGASDSKARDGAYASIGFRRSF